MNSPLLIEDNPLVISPKLAKLLHQLCPHVNAAHAAMSLQQIHYWASKGMGKVIDGGRWIWNSIRQWQEDNFSWLSAWEIRKVFKALREVGLVKFEKFDRSNFDHTGYYRIDYERLKALQLSICVDTHIDVCTAHKSETETTTPEITINKISPPTSSNEVIIPKEEKEQEREIKKFLGIKSNCLTLNTLNAMLKPIYSVLDSLEDQSSAAAPSPVEKPIPARYQTDEQAPAATASVLRKLSEITGLSVELLRTNVGLQKALREHADAVDGVLGHLQSGWKSTSRPGIGYVVQALRNRIKPEKVGGQGFREWVDEGKARGLIDFTMGEGNDIHVQFVSGKAGLYSKLQQLSWEALAARYGK